MSFLSKLSKLKKSSSSAQSRKGLVKTNEPEESLLPKSYVREEDDAVKRLKELRKKELLKNGGDVHKKSAAKKESSLKSSTTKSSSRRPKNRDSHSETTYKRKIGERTKGASYQGSNNVISRKEHTKKMSFDELMKQAETNKTKPEIDMNKQNLPKPARRLSKPGFKPSKYARNNQIAKANSTDLNSERKSHNSNNLRDTPSLSKPSGEESPVVVQIPKNNFARPNEKIRKMLDSRKRSHKRQYDYDDEEEDDMSDFIEDDEGEEDSYHNYDRRKADRDPGYDRDEIWAMFNKGKKRSDYGYDDYYEDDMEANEFEIMEEEEEARKIARIEDKQEEAWLKSHEAAKKKRKNFR
ncbi:hypothetical protein TBLA_0F03750 [Henningerozyma blattae CBS 6284]|uniref:Uncharacterized protein n=1 Tax=Henningerozyma blattae (strain ATCC 34711 / CBS 6284 / DSM 70876 / NBRC 10599 / NRRL Y-10934 / UCD 77-7) TaxID=1071380 RepID=I2H6A8_HENB6|nr:hypothetical protein TBLA_0F03750 [Tetrapisispora blattae CBS 6284]CCH61910.1 hypothetical protein TBLA_0F03750 [Tetrapisispora blattae CBS 6284]